MSKSRFLVLAVPLCCSAPAAVLVDNFGSYTGGGAQFAPQTSAWSNFGGNQFLVDSSSSLAGAGSGNAIDAPTGGPNHTGSNTIQLGAGEDFLAQVLVGYDSTALFGGLFVGTSSTNNATVQLRDSDTAIGANPGSLFRVTTTADGTIGTNSSATSQADIWYRLSVRGTQGSNQLSVSIEDTENDTTLVSNAVFDMGTYVIPLNARFGLISDSSNSHKFDDFTIYTGADVPPIPEPSAGILVAAAGLLLGFRRTRA